MNNSQDNYIKFLEAENKEKSGRLEAALRCIDSLEVSLNRLKVRTEKFEKELNALEQK